MWFRGFQQHIYVRVYVDRLLIRVPGQTTPTVTILPQEPFSTNRLLVGNLQSAVRAMKQGIREVLPGRWRLLRPRVLLQAMERIDGGTSEVERNALKEVAEQAGAMEVFLLIKPFRELTDDEVMTYFTGGSA